MFVATFDDQQLISNHVDYFISNTLLYENLNFLCNSNNVSSISKKHRNNNNIIFTESNNKTELNKELELFRSTYTHYSTKDYRKTCSFFERWLVLNFFTNHLGDNDYICMLDNDMMLGMNCEEIMLICSNSCKKSCHKFDLIAEWESSSNLRIGPELSIFTKKFISKYCLFLQTVFYSEGMKTQLMELYRDQFIKKSGSGINDMHALALFSNYENANTFNLRDVKSNIFIDNINEFASNKNRDNRWTIYHQNSKQYLKEKENEIQLIGIHFQGIAKKAIPYFIEQKHINNTVFRNQTQEPTVLQRIKQLLSINTYNKFTSRTSTPDNL